MPGPRRVDLTRIMEPLESIFLHRLVEPEARPHVGADSIDQRLFDQAGEEVDDCFSCLLGGGADRFHGFQIEVSHENAELSEQRLFVRRKQVIAPVDRCAECLLPRDPGPTSTYEQVETVLQTRDDLFNPQGARADRRQLECKWHPIQTAAELDNGHMVFSRKLKLATCCSRPFTEQGDRFELTELVNRRRRTDLGNRERWHGIDELSVAVERLTAGGQDSDAWRPTENRTNNNRARVQQMLAVVQNKEQLLVLQVVDQQRNGGSTCLVAHAQRGHDD